MGAQEFIEALVPSDIDPADTQRLQLFGQFVGSWDLVVTEYAGDGTPTVSPGEWHFWWLLAGRAVADVWIFPARATGAPNVEHGMSVRFPDPTDPSGATWRSTWIGPGRGLVHPFTARAVGDEIVLSGTFADDTETRWIFSAITADTFQWRNETRKAGVDDWTLHQTFAARRL